MKGINIKKYFKCLIFFLMSIAFMISLSVPVFAYKGFKQPDGTEIEYYTEIDGTIRYDVPYIIRKITPENGLNTVKYTINEASNPEKTAGKRIVVNTGGYLSVNNVIRESTHNDMRLLYAKGPVKLTFHGDYLLSRRVTEYTRFSIKNGRVLYDIAYDYRTKEESNNDIMYTADVPDDQTYTLTKPGMYLVSHGLYCGGGISVFVYVTDNIEETVYKPLKTETAIPIQAKINVNGKMPFPQ